MCVCVCVCLHIYIHTMEVFTLKNKISSIMYENSAPTSQITQYVSVTKADLLMMFEETGVV